VKCWLLDAQHDEDVVREVDEQQLPGRNKGSFDRVLSEYLMKTRDWAQSPDRSGQ
jgi:hypothetical protein